MLIGLLVFLIVTCSIIVIFLVIIQNSKGGGLASNFQSVSGASQIFGARTTANWVERGTWYFIGIIVLLTFIINISYAVGGKGTGKQSHLRMDSQIEAQHIQTAPTSLPITPQPAPAAKPAPKGK